MKKHLLPVCLLAIAFFTAIAWQVKPGVKKPAVDVSAGYESSWKTIDSLTKKGLYKSAGESVELLYQKARTEGNMPQLVKAALYRSRYQSMEGEDGFISIISDLERDCNEVTFPGRPILHSILAEVYWRYYEQNRWRFLGRSTTTGVIETDIRTWDLQKILDKTVEHYNLSLEPAETLKLFPVDMYDLVITNGSLNTRELRPLLYDFLGHRAADFFMNNEAGVSRPESGFDMNKKEYFINSFDFAKLNITSPDTLDFHYRALKILQELIRTHLQQLNHDALIDVDMKRLRFIYANATVDQQDTIYIAALRNIAQQDEKFPEATQALYEIARIYEQYGYAYAQGADPSKKGYLKKAEEVCNLAISRYPYSLGGLQCKEMKARLIQKSLAVVSSMAYAPGENLKLKLAYRNIQKVFVRLVRTPGDAEAGPSDQDKKLKAYLKMQQVKQWSIDLPADDDRQEHVTEFRIDTLPVGSYALLVSSSDKFTSEKEAISVTEFYVSNLSLLSRRASDGQLEVQVLQRDGGRPVQGVTINTWMSGYDYTARKYQVRKGDTFTTDGEGRVFIPSQNNYQQVRLELIKDNDRLFTPDNFSLNSYQPGERTFSEQTYFFTDRSIYRPGQVVYFKGLVLETNGDESHIKKAQKTTAHFYDVNGQQIAEAALQTNDFGTFNGTFTAPQTGITGNMTIGNESGSTAISVEEYKRPKFEVTFDPILSAFRLGDEIRVTGKALTYSGAAVDNGKIHYKVTRRMKYVPWAMWKSSISPAVQEVTIAQGTAAGDASGKFTVSFEARPDFGISSSSDPVFVFTVTADVTDLNGETRSGKVSQEVSYKSVSMSINVPEQLQKEKTEPWILSAVNSAGQKQVMTGEIIVSRLQQPERPLRKSMWNLPDKPLLTDADYQKYFPLDERGNGDPVKWKKEKETYRSKFDLSKDSVFRPSVANWTSGYYLLEVHSRDNYGDPVTIIRPFVLYSPAEKNSPVVQPFWLRPVRNNAEPGSSDTFLLATGENELSVLYELEQKNKIIKREWLTLQKEQKIVVIPVQESYRGNVTAHFTVVKNNRQYAQDETLTVPWTNKELEITLQTFRNKAEPGSKEEWNVTVKGKNGEKAAAEMLASMYDASLDAFKPHGWSFDIYPHYTPALPLTPHTFGNGYSWLFSKNWNEGVKPAVRNYDELNWFGFYGGYRGGRGGGVMYEVAIADNANVPSGSVDAVQEKAVAYKGTFDESKSRQKNGENPAESSASAPLTRARTNFNETAFFYPQLRTNEKGEIVFSFTLPDALTRWKAQFFAHTQNLSFGLKEQEIITQKELMIFSNAPRFVREGDTLELPVKITSMSEHTQSVTSTISFADALTGKDITAELMSHHATSVTDSVEAGQSTAISWKIIVPHTYQAISYTAAATAAGHSDAETMIIPVLPDRILVTETMPFSLRSNQSKTIVFDRLQNNTSSTLQHQSFSLEYTANPAWYAVQSLPYLMEYPYECLEQIFSRYYANAIATNIVQSRPAIKTVFEQWKLAGKEAFLSNLEKNQELKSVLLEETPWVRDAASEQEQKQRIALLFDLNKMSSELQAALNKLMERQSSNGGWPWFGGMPEDRYITQYIVEGMGHLGKLGVVDLKKDERVAAMLKKAVDYCDRRIADDYKELGRIKADLSKKQLSSFQIHYLYMRSFFPDYNYAGDSKKAAQYYEGQAKKFWTDYDLSLEAMIALVMNRHEDAQTSGDILKSLRERSKTSEEMGMYWPSNESGFTWSQATVETQSVIMEAFNEIAHDKSAVDEMKLWLLKNKQTNSWKTTKATAEACYALLLTGSDWLTNPAPPQITLGGKKLEPVAAEAGTGYFKESWNGKEVTPSMAKLEIKNTNSNPAWGAMYWQYYEDLDKITSASNLPLRIARKLFVERSSGKSTVAELMTDTTTLRPGDRVKVRVIIQCDRDLQYVHVKDLRAAGFEPENVLSGYKYQDGLSYYESTRDAATNFFIGFLPKGMYVFEYPVRAAQVGSYSNGVATIQCMYAPEFAAHSEGFRVRIK